MQLQVVSTVTTPAPSYTLVTLPVVKDELQIDPNDNANNAWLLRVISQVSAAVVAYCNNPFVVESRQDVFFPDLDNYPYQVPGGIDRLQLRRWPVSAVAAVTTTDFNGNVTTLTAGSGANGVPGYNVEMNAGQLTQLDPYTSYPALWSPMQTTVSYTAGYATIPPDVEAVLLSMITARYRGRGRDPYLRAEDTNGVGRREWWVPGAPMMRGSLPEEIAAALDNYRVPVIA